ncbi:CPBP family intramembrane metalloprotease [Streptococcus sp. X16XC17]|nr:CPBP family intramembrane metalloprotease [Streptococcus sp. X16XC17]
MAEICIFGPIFEELLYRGLIMTQFFKNSPLYLDVLLSAIIFSLSHLIISHLSLLDFLIYFNIGLVFALIFRKTKNIYYSVMLHMVVNIAASIPELKSIYVYVKFWIVMTFF